MSKVSEQIKLKKEWRRAKRKNSWIAEGNIVPLSTREKKAIRNRTYRMQKDKVQNLDGLSFELKYRNSMQAFVSTQSYNVKGGFNYKSDVSTFKCFKDATGIFETLYLRGIIKNYFFVVDYEPSHSHTHFIVNAVNPNTVDLHIRKLFNRFNQGYAWHETIKTNYELENAIEYCINKLEVNGWIKQKGIDYWGIRTEVITNPILPVVEKV